MNLPEFTEEYSTELILILVFGLLVTGVFSYFKINRLNSKISDLESKNDRLNDEVVSVRNNLTETINRKENKINSLSNNISDLKDEKENILSYTLINYSKAKEMNISSEKYKKAYRAYLNFSSSLKTATNIVSWGNHYYKDEGYYSEAAACYYLASLSYKRARDNLITMRNQFSDQETRDKLEKGVKTIDNLKITFEKYKSLMYAYYNDNGEKASQLESEIQDLGDKINKQALEIRLMD